jgi:hypothetical protein
MPILSRTSAVDACRLACHLGAVASVLLLHGQPLAGQQPQPTTLARVDESRVKAAYVYRFPQFVEWPSEALSSAETLDVCVLRPNPFGSDLQQLTRGETINGKSLRVRDIAGSQELAGCHVVFAGASSAATSAVLRAAAGRPILTVGETDRFLDEGGIIAFKVVERRVRFEVHAANAQRAGLRINAQLLNLALAVHGGPSS